MDNVDGIFRVSIVIPTYNEGIWLKRTVQSILSANNDLRYEILVVDDGCSDGSVQAILDMPLVQIVPTGGEKLGSIVGRNIGAKVAVGEYLCFVDSHVLVQNHWLDYLRQTCDAYPDGALVSGNLLDVDSDVNAPRLDHGQFGYTIGNLRLGTNWHFYGNPYTDKPYLQPLTPGGLMFARKSHFNQLGGFDSLLRKWGAEDIQISLRNYYVGGDNVVDPRVVVYHRFKNDRTRPGGFDVSKQEYAFNCLYVAATYLPPSHYSKVKQAFGRRGRRAAEQVESPEYRKRLEKVQSEFVRSFYDWTTQFATELCDFSAALST